MFEKAARLKLRFSSPKGLLTVEDLYSLPLLAKMSAHTDLNAVVQSANAELSVCNVENFVGTFTCDTERETAQLRLDIIKHIIAVKQAEINASEEAAARASQKAFIRKIIAEKQLEGIKGKSLDELNDLLAGL